MNRAELVADADFAETDWLRPRPDFTWIRLWDQAAIDPAIHEERRYNDHTIFVCKYCRWEAGTFGGLNYIREPYSGWYEIDPGLCRCVFLDRGGSLITSNTLFLVADSFQLHGCDLPTRHGVFDFNERLCDWNEVTALSSFRRNLNDALRRW